MKLSKKVENELKEYQDLKYLEMFGYDDSIGVRIPVLRKYAKELSKEYELEYLLENINENYHEEVMLKGILIGLNKELEWKELKKYIRYYVPKITTWDLCDIVCSGLKITKKYENKMWDLIQEYLKSDKEFYVRFGLVMILSYYIKDEYIDQIFKIIQDVKLDKYYTKMANAWLISYCVIKKYDKTFKFLKEDTKIDKWTFNKGIQKSIESFRVIDEHKEELKKLKR